MPCIVRTPQAKRDAAEIWAYIAADSETTADALIDQIETRLRHLRQFPEAGDSVEYIRPDVRRSTLGNYVIYYVPLSDGITASCGEDRGDWPGCVRR